jgi:hypothetical protein
LQHLRRATVLIVTMGRRKRKKNNCSPCVRERVLHVSWNARPTDSVCDFRSFDCTGSVQR